MVVMPGSAARGALGRVRGQAEVRSWRGRFVSQKVMKIDLQKIGTRWHVPLLELSILILSCLPKIRAQHSSSSGVTLEKVACQRRARASASVLISCCGRGQGACYAALENVNVVTAVSWTSQVHFSELLGERFPIGIPFLDTGKRL